MARSCMMCLLAAAATTLLPAFVLPPSRASKVERSTAWAGAIKTADAEPSPESNHAGVLLAAAATVGLLAGLVTGPDAAWARGKREGFYVALERPGYMSGIDAANAATKPGQIDFVTRSRIEFLQLPETLKALEKERQILDAAPSKEVRVRNGLAQLREYAKTAQIPM
eukprot:TRINITY_DN1367_c0_g1_i4.p1 TRINITY_DN1367_c0_g1~~TRINITY_DN1367_c0_g1_i4.p1  ORF type:complete len:168 (-),score=52.11 TRINITY_DN1367_c0_g1_i4:126-629(-)